MSAWNTGHAVQPTQRPPKRTKPIQEQIEELYEETIQKMESVWLEYYHKYAK